MFFLFRTRPVLVIQPRPFVTRFSRIGLNAIHEGWRVPAPLVLVIVQFAKCAPPPAPVRARLAQHIEVIAIISLDFSHGNIVPGEFGQCARRSPIVALNCASVKFTHVASRRCLFSRTKRDISAKARKRLLVYIDFRVPHVPHQVCL